MAFASGIMMMTLRGNEPTPASGDMVPLFLWSTTESGIFNTLPLVLPDTNSQISGVLNLYVGGYQDPQTNTSTLNLYLKSEIPTTTNTLDLFVKNNTEQSSGTLSLFLQGVPGSSGYIANSGTMNLFIGRDSESIAHNISMYISGPILSSGTLSLFLKSGSENSGIPLFLQANAQPSSGVLKLFTHGF